MAEHKYICIPHIDFHLIDSLLTEKVEKFGENAFFIGHSIHEGSSIAAAYFEVSFGKAEEFIDSVYCHTEEKQISAHEVKRQSVEEEITKSSFKLVKSLSPSSRSVKRGLLSMPSEDDSLLDAPSIPIDPETKAEASSSVDSKLLESKIMQKLPESLSKKNESIVSSSKSTDISGTKMYCSSESISNSGVSDANLTVSGSKCIEATSSSSRTTFIGENLSSDLKTPSEQSPIVSSLTDTSPADSKVNLEVNIAGELTKCIKDAQLNITKARTSSENLGQGSENPSSSRSTPKFMNKLLSRVKEGSSRTSSMYAEPSETAGSSIESLTNFQSENDSPASGGNGESSQINRSADNQELDRPETLEEPTEDVGKEKNEDKENRRPSSRLSVHEEALRRECCSIL